MAATNLRDLMNGVERLVQECERTHIWDAYCLLAEAGCRPDWALQKLLRMPLYPTGYPRFDLPEDALWQTLVVERLSQARSLCYERPPKAWAAEFEKLLGQRRAEAKAAEEEEAARIAAEEVKTEGAA